MDDEFTYEPCRRCLRGDVIYAADGHCISALSRADNATDVCDQCGADEAYRWGVEDEVIPTHEWPVEDPHRYSPPRVA